MNDALMIEVIPATAEQELIVANLLELYAHDFSEFHEIELAADGRFGYPDLSLYWREPGRHPFLVRVDDKLAGLVLVKLVKRDPKQVWDIAEFFVVRTYRRSGVGTCVAHEVWRRFPGPWEVRVMESNHSARGFWQRAIAEFTGATISPGRFENAGQAWHVFSFEAKR